MADNFLELLEKKWEKTRSGKKEIEKLKERIKETMRTTAKNNAAETQKKQEAQITKLSEELKKLPEKDEAIKSLEKKNEDLKSNLEVNKKLLEEQINKVKQLEQELFESDEKSKLKKEINERLLSEKTEKDKIFLIFFNYLRTYSNALEINKLEEISSQASQAREKYIKSIDEFKDKSSENNMGVDDLFENKKKIFTIAKIQESTEFPLNQKYKGLKITFAEPINYYDGYYREEAKGLIMQYKLLREKG
ncbi:18467_t:CDS:2 [Racocetra persica]|uniref:18467_t:CDS:1 n=1 Tax=Racocetra persica TaxID=160502 RepID=A0ACA9RL10_9GLOM|nr:18467_t:CDS:2 [Racocetra persica]